MLNIELVISQASDTILFSIQMKILSRLYDTKL